MGLLVTRRASTAKVGGRVNIASWIPIDELVLNGGAEQMKCIVMAGIAALLSAPAAAGHSTPTQVVTSLIASFVDAVNKGDVPHALAHLAKDVSITEELAPFRWQGPDAGSAWLTAMQKNSERLGVTDILMKLGKPTQVLVEGERAYEVVPGVVTLKGKQQVLHENGVLTFALQRLGGDWKIVSFA